MVVDGAVVERVGAVARLAGGTAEGVIVDIRELADLSDGRRIVTEWRHGSKTLQAPRGQLGVASVERDVRRLMGQRGFMERVNGWASRVRGLTWELQTGFDRRRRRGRWSALVRALDERGIAASRRALNRAPFSIEMDDDLREEL